MPAAAAPASPRQHPPAMASAAAAAADTATLRELTLVKRLEEENYLKKLLADQIRTQAQADRERQQHLPHQHQHHHHHQQLLLWSGFDGDSTSNDTSSASLPSLSAPPNATPAHQNTNFLYINHDSSSSDLNSPLTPTFSQRGAGHLRGSSSSSSLELVAPPSAAECPSPTTLPPLSQAQAPAPVAHASIPSSISGAGPAKSPLPDVQEDPLERDEELGALSERLDLYTCLCDEPCLHKEPEHGAWTTHANYPLDYDCDFLSDNDADAAPRDTARRRRAGTLSSATGLTSRFGSRIASLTRLKAAKAPGRHFNSASEPSLKRSQSLSRTFSRAPSSRSSSLSAPTRQVPPDRANEPPLPPTPALSFYGSTDSIASPGAPLDIERPNVRRSLERDRALATTPLLPPLMTSSVISAHSQPSRQPSPLQSPSVAASMAPSPSAEAFSPMACATPPLSTRPSVSSFRPRLATSFSAPVVAPADALLSPITNLLEQQDSWSDRLGHANYTVLPRAYRPAADLGALRAFRADWDQARINYTKHLVRTGEHYGMTSNTYALTEDKWAETEAEWRAAHDAAIECITAHGGDTTEELQWRRLQDDILPTAVPRILDAEGKFPGLGDEDIVGPMMRDAVMVRSPGAEERHGSASKFFKSLAGKVGLKR